MSFSRPAWLLLVAVACARPGEPVPAAVVDAEPRADPAGVAREIVEPAKPRFEDPTVEVPGGVLNGVEIPGFSIDVTETTVAAFRRCVEVGVCSAPNPRCQFSLYHRPDVESYPINCVTRDQAAAYCAWQGKRLPTELEWQWEAQGGDENREHPWGSAIATCEHANLYFGGTIPPSPKGNCGRDWSPVGSRPLGASRHGALDMQGNVSEWTSDSWGTDAVVKGEAANVDISAELLDPAGSFVSDPARGSSDIGFRCVR